MDDNDLYAVERSCQRLICEYAQLADHGKTAQIADLFTDDGVFVWGEFILSGRKQLLGAFRVAQDQGGVTSRHVCTNILVRVIDADHAEGVTYLTLFEHRGPTPRGVAPGGAPTLIGEYRDTFANTPTGWRFRRRELHVSFHQNARDPA